MLPRTLALFFPLVCFWSLLSCSSIDSDKHLMAKGHYEAVLKKVRPTNSKAYFVRARALAQLGHLSRARTEVLIGLSTSPRSAEGLRLLGQIETELGFLRSALTAFEGSLLVDPDQQVVKKKVAQLLLQRAQFLLLPKTGRGGATRAVNDLKKAAKLDSGIKEEALALAQQIKKSGHGSKSVKIWLEGKKMKSKGVGITPVCPGIPTLAMTPKPNRAKRCTLDTPRLPWETVKRWQLVLGCEGWQTATMLEAKGCLEHAFKVWRELASEAPHEPRWQLMLARNVLLKRQPARAEIFFTHYIYLSRDRSEALEASARVLVQTGYCRLAGKKAVESIIFAKKLAQVLASITLLRTCGLEQEATQAARLVLNKSWSPFSKEEAQKQIEQRIKGPPTNKYVAPRGPRRPPGKAGGGRIH